MKSIHDCNIGRLEGNDMANNTILTKIGEDAYLFLKQKKKE